MIMTTAALVEKKEAEASTSPDIEFLIPTPPTSSREVRSMAGPSRERYNVPPPAYDDLYLPATTRSHAAPMHDYLAHAPPFTPSLTSSTSTAIQQYPFATSAGRRYFPDLPGDNPRGIIGRMKNVAPGKSPAVLLNPPPPPFRRTPPADIARDAFPIMVLVGEGTSIDKGFAYVAPESPISPHPFGTRDVNEHDWRLFLHDVRLAGSLSPMNKVVSGLAPLATGIGIVWPVAIYKGVESLMRKSKVKGPVSQLIEYWNNFFFHPRGMHVSLTRGPPKYVHVPVAPKATEDKKWRLVVSYRPAYLQSQDPGVLITPSAKEGSLVTSYSS